MLEESSLDAATLAMIIVLRQSLPLLRFLCIGNAQKNCGGLYTRVNTIWCLVGFKKWYCHSV